MRTCWNCSRQNPDETKICPGCGQMFLVGADEGEEQVDWKAVERAVRQLLDTRGLATPRMLVAFPAKIRAALLVEYYKAHPDEGLTMEGSTLIRGQPESRSIPAPSTVAREDPKASRRVAAPGAPTISPAPASVSPATGSDSPVTPAMCFYHPMLASVRTCEQCGRPMCAVCTAGGKLCLTCQRPQATLVQRKPVRRRTVAVWIGLAAAVVLVVGAGSLLLDRTTKLRDLYDRGVEALFVAGDANTAIRPLSQLAAQDPNFNGERGRAMDLLAAAQDTATAIPLATWAAATATAEAQEGRTNRMTGRTATAEARLAQNTVVAASVATLARSAATSQAATREANRTQEALTQQANFATDTASSVQTATAYQATMAAVGTTNAGATVVAGQTATVEIANTRAAATITAIAIQAATATREAKTRKLVPVPITSLANHAMDFLDNPPAGTVTLGNIPFVIGTGARAEFHTADHEEPTLPVDGVMPISIAAPHAVYVLIGGRYTDPSAVGRLAGSVELRFADGSTQTTSLIIGHNLRDTWSDNSGSQVTTADPSSGWQNVWQESQSRDGHPAIAFLDMLTIQTPNSAWTSKLVRITVHDTSQINGTVDPGLRLVAVTVLSIP